MPRSPESASSSVRIKVVTAAAFLLGAITIAPSAWALDLYQNPDGTYPSLADEVRDVDGTPCGIECTAQAEKRWADAGSPSHVSGHIAHERWYGDYPANR